MKLFLSSHLIHAAKIFAFNASETLRNIGEKSPPDLAAALLDNLGVALHAYADREDNGVGRLRNKVTANVQARRDRLVRSTAELGPLLLRPLDHVAELARLQQIDALAPFLSRDALLVAHGATMYCDGRGDYMNVTAPGCGCCNYSPCDCAPEMKKTDGG